MGTFLLYKHQLRKRKNHGPYKYCAGESIHKRNGVGNDLKLLNTDTQVLQNLERMSHNFKKKCNLGGRDRSTAV
jgi:hypothetical protein